MTGDPLATLEVKQQAGSVTVTVAGEVDLSNADDLERRIEAATEGMSLVTVDLRAVRYMDSRGVRLVHQLARRLASDDVSVRVLAPSDTFAGGVLRLTGLADLHPDD